MSTKHVVILKNDAVGDLVHSLKSIYNVTNANDINKITIFVSKLSKNSYFFWLIELIEFIYFHLKTFIIIFHYFFLERSFMLYVLKMLVVIKDRHYF